QAALDALAGGHLRPGRDPLSLLAGAAGAPERSAPGHRLRSRPRLPPAAGGGALAAAVLPRLGPAARAPPGRGGLRALRDDAAGPARRLSPARPGGQGGGRALGPDRTACRRAAASP